MYRLTSARTSGQIHRAEDADQEPEIHLRTYIALAAMFALNYVQIIALQGPPVVVST